MKMHISIAFRLQTKPSRVSCFSLQFVGKISISETTACVCASAQAFDCCHCTTPVNYLPNSTLKGYPLKHIELHTNNCRQHSKTTAWQRIGLVQYFPGSLDLCAGRFTCNVCRAPSPSFAKSRQDMRKGEASNLCSSRARKRCPDVTFRWRQNCLNNTSSVWHWEETYHPTFILANVGFTGILHVNKCMCASSWFQKAPCNIKKCNYMYMSYPIELLLLLVWKQRRFITCIIKGSTNFLAVKVQQNQLIF